MEVRGVSAKGRKCKGDTCKGEEVHERVEREGSWGEGFLVESGSGRRERRRGILGRREEGEG